MASSYGTLDTKVTIVEMVERILPTKASICRGRR